MNEQPAACPNPCLTCCAGPASARCLGPQTAAASVQTGLSRKSGYLSSPHRNLRESSEEQPLRHLSNGRVKRIGKSRAWTTGRGLTVGLCPATHKSDLPTDRRSCKLYPAMASRETERLRFSAHRSQILTQSRSRPGRQVVIKPTSSRYHRPARKAPRFLSPDPQGSARRLVFPTCSFNVTHLREMIRAFDPLAFYVSVDANYPGRQSSDFSQKARAVLLNWVLLVHRKFGFRFQTFFTAVLLLDSFLSRNSVPTADLQLLGLTVLFTASKFEEVKPPKLAKFLTITEKQFRQQDVIELEGRILASIDFRVSTQSPAQLLEVVVELERLPRIISETALGFLVASCFDLRMNVFGSDRIVQAAISLATKVVQSMNQREGVQGSIPRLLDLASISAEGSAAQCMRNLSLIVLNLERAGMLAIRKAFPESFERGCDDSLALINHC